jgi:hypothetical protein
MVQVIAGKKFKNIKTILEQLKTTKDNFCFADNLESILSDL